MAELAVTTIGADQPGIIAAVAEVLRDHGGNVEDSAMTVLGGRFAIMLLVEIDVEPEVLEDALREATASMELTVAVTPAGESTAPAEPTHVLSVYGSDRPGILAGVTRTLAESEANVTDLETRLLASDDDPVYAMIIEAAVPDEVALVEALEGVCDDLGVDHTLRPIETETY